MSDIYDELDEEVQATGKKVPPKAIELASKLLEEVLPDEDWGDAHHEGTPRRFAQMLYDLTHPAPFEFTTFPNDLEVNEMIVEKDIPFYSLCAHHLVPFHGHAHVAYIPNERIAGLSKLARVVKSTAKGIWVQEHLNDMIVLHLEENLRPQGVAVVMEAEHMCMSMRGAEISGAKTITSTMKGVFMDHSRQARSEFLSLIRNGR